MSTSPSPASPSEAGLSSHALALLASLVGYVRARLELAKLEGKDALGVYLTAAILLVLTLGGLAFGYALLWVALIALLSTLCAVHWGWWLLGAGALHLIFAVAALFGAFWFIKKPTFSATLEEFQKDQEWLRNAGRPQ